MDNGVFKQIHVHVPLKVSVMIVVEADDHVRKMSGLVVVVDSWWGVPVSWFRSYIVKADEGKKVVGCEGVSRLLRQSRHFRHAPPIH